ncbi:hypothetical protein ACFY3G_47650 [Streptomyces phaeochromogenes]|uniref:hypothetical protein n=1 Tax=Streptomyces phaeochromogenes TaxID=1923 RepID=UPI00368E20D5
MLKTGARLRSQVCGTEVIVVRGNNADAVLHCGGHPMIDLTAGPARGFAIDVGFAEGSVLGKRYTDDDNTVEVLVTHAGAGSLAVDGKVLTLKSAKPLPSSD